ncbi:MAG: hypothetical protein GX021_04070 [Tissierellia bacterium]|nr:hypothetical protein [Tissierellia bacterium]
MDYKEYLNNMERKLKSYFDIERDYDLNGYPLDLYAKYHFRNERYVLSKKFVVYGQENNEYIFIKYFEEVGEISLKEYIDFLVKSIDILVEPDNDHMSSVITGVLLTNHKPKIEVIETIKKFKYHKGFAFGFKGWVDIRLILVTMDGECIVTNKKGKEVSSVYCIQ